MKQLVPQFDQTLLWATEQALSLIMFTEVSRRPAPAMPAPAAPAVHAVIRLVSYSEGLHVSLMLRCARACAVQMAARMLQIPADEANRAEMMIDTVGEVINIIGGCLKTAWGEHVSDFVLGLPDVQEKPAGEFPPLPAHASLLHFAGGEDLQFSVALMKEVSCVRTCHR